MRKEINRWYPVSLMGKIVVALYAFVPPYITYAQTAGTLDPELQTPLMTGMILVLACMLICKATGQTPFRAEHKK